MSTTLSDVLKGIAAFINQDPDLANITAGSDEDMWINLVNQAQNEWSDSFVWRKTLNKQFNVPVSNSMVSFALPADFRRLNSPVFDRSDISDNQYYEIIPQDRYNKDVTDKYVWRIGNDKDGFALNINPALVSGASIVFDYISRPTSLVTYQDVLTCPSSQFIIQRAISKVLAARSDPRFTFLHEQSNSLLGQMEDDESSPTAGQDNQTPTNFGRKGFRVGE